MVSSGTLESVEFLEVVGGDLEVAPGQYFEVKVEGPQKHSLGRERSVKTVQNIHTIQFFPHKSTHSSTKHD